MKQRIAWTTAWRLRRRANLVRSLGWAIFGLCVVSACAFALAADDDELSLLQLGLLAVATATVVLFASRIIAALYEKRAEWSIKNGNRSKKS